MKIKIFEVNKNELNNQIGIHLLDPTKQEIDAAIEIAERDMFPAVYIHRSFQIKASLVDTIQV